GADNTIKQWNAADGKPIRSLAGHTAAVISLSYAAKGALLVSGSADMTARVWNAADGAPVRTIPVGAVVAAGAGSPAAATILTAGADKLVKIWKAADGTAAGSFAGHAAPVVGVRFSADGARIVSASADGVAHVWLPTGLALQSFTTPNLAMTSVAIAPD